MENKTNELEIKRSAAKEWIEACGDGEIKRMYGHHMRSFIAGWDAASLQSSKDREAFDQLKVDYDNLQSLSDQQEERIKELKDERDSLSQMVLEMVGESEEQIMKEFLEFKLNRKA